MKHQTVRGMTRRLLNVWRKCSAEDKRDGMSWYHEAGQFARAIADASGGKVTAEQVAAVIAITSPKQKWALQKVFVPLIVADYVRGLPECTVRFGFNRFLTKAWRVLTENDFGQVSGPKVTRFFLNICGDCSVVTVDRWAIRVAWGLKDQAEYNSRITSAQYLAIEQAYKRAAELVGVEASDFQAALWVWARRTSLGTEE